MFRTIHRATMLSALALLGLLAGCRKENEADDKSDKNGPPPSSSNNPFDAISKTRGAADRANTSNNLKRMMLAMHNYEGTYQYFPGMVFDKKDGKPLLSWRVAILPYLEEDNLAKRFKMDEPWDSPNNKALLSEMPKVFATPGKTKPGETDTHYRVFVSDPTSMSIYRAPFCLTGPPKGQAPLKMFSITDGLSNTIAIVEAAEAAPWTKPEGLEFDEKKPLPKMADFWNGGFTIAMFDGSVRSAPGKFDEKEMRKAISYADGLILGNFP